jgi:hypothetical protein
MTRAPQSFVVMVAIALAVGLTGCGTSAEVPVADGPLQSVESELRSTSTACTDDTVCVTGFCNANSTPKCSGGYCQTDCSTAYQFCCQTSPGSYSCLASSSLCTTSNDCPSNFFCLNGRCLGNYYLDKCRAL